MCRSDQYLRCWYEGVLVCSACAVPFVLQVRKVRDGREERDIFGTRDVFRGRA